MAHRVHPLAETRFALVFLSLRDPRVQRTRKYELLDLLVITVLGVICGADGWDDLEAFASTRAVWLRTFTQLPDHETPSASTFERLFARLKPRAFTECFIAWIEDLREHRKGDIVPIDGQTLRRSFDRTKGRNPLHVVSAWSSANSLTLGQIAVDAKSNETTAIPALLEMLDLKGSVVTIDAMGATVPIAQAVLDASADYVIALKDNQRTIYEEAALAAGRVRDKKEPTVTAPMNLQSNDGHGREEVRQLWAMPAKLVPSSRKFPGIRSVLAIRSVRTVANETTEEWRYYLTSLAPRNASLLNQIVRTHWSIENRLHWRLDMGFRQDESRIRNHTAQDNLSVIRKFALTMLSRVPYKRRGIAARRKIASWSNPYLLDVLTAGIAAP